MTSAQGSSIRSQMAALLARVLAIALVVGMVPASAQTWRSPAASYRVALRAQLEGINQQIAWNAVVADSMSGVVGTPVPFGAATTTPQPQAPGLSPEMTMTAAERAEVIELLQKSEQELEKAIAGLTDAQWTFKPGPDRWSVGEVVEHIVLADALLFETAIKSLDTPLNAKWEGTLVKTNLIRKAIPDRSRKVDAPAAIRPQQAMARAALIARFKDQRAKALAYVRDTNKPLKGHTAANPFFGDLNAHQWLLYIPLHHIRHNQQIAEVQASPGYPR